MIDLSQINRVLITSSSCFKEWFNIVKCGEDKSDFLGFDIETDGVKFPNTKLAGFSLYYKPFKMACYVPVEHREDDIKYCVALEDIKEELQYLFSNYYITVHNGAYDVLLMNQKGFNFETLFDTYILSNYLQFMNTGLKDLVLEFGLASFRDVITFRKLMLNLNLSGDSVDFSSINIRECKDAFDYAINDSIFVSYLAGELCLKYANLIGDPNYAFDNFKAQINTLLLLNMSSARGYYIDREILNSFVDQFQIELAEKEKVLMNKVRDLMGWERRNPD